MSIYESQMVSIVMPAWNSEKFISESIDSVLAQNYENFELLVVDDCSVDSTSEIVMKYVKADNRVKMISLQENSGPAVARNSAIEAATGRYIAFLDSDDLWYPEKLERQIEFLKNNNIALTYSGYDVLDEDGSLLSVFRPPTSIRYEDLLKTCSIGCLTAIYDAGLIGKMKMPLIKKRQDYALWLKILKAVSLSMGCESSLAAYRIRNNSVSRGKLNAAKYQWYVYRQIEGIGFMKSLYYFIHYAYNGYYKYVRG